MPALIERGVLVLNIARTRELSLGRLDRASLEDLEVLEVVMNPYSLTPESQQPSNPPEQTQAAAPWQPTPPAVTGQPPYGTPLPAPYGQFAPSLPSPQYSQPSYGQYAPPGWYPQPPSPGAPPAGYVPVGSSASAGLKRRKRTVIAVILAALVALLVIGGIVRYNSPAAAMKSFIQAFYANDVDAAYGLYCPEVQAIYTRSQQASSMAGVDSHLNSYDLSPLSYTIVDEALTSADVRLDGYFTYTDTSGNAGTWRSADNATDVFNLRAQGLGWCIWGVAGHKPSAPTG